MKPLAIRLVSVLCVFALGICIVLSSSPAARAAGDISGTVTNQLGQPASSIFVDAYEASTGDWIDSASTDENGTYTMAALVDGHDYKLHFTDQNASYAMEWYSDAPTFQAATGVTAPAAGIDAQLGPGVEISGTVIEAGTGTPVENCTAYLYDPTMNIFLTSFTGDANGVFHVTGVASGTALKLNFDDSGQHAPLWYNGKVSWQTADPVTAPAAGLQVQLAVGGTETIAGTVTDGVGTALEGIQVAAFDEDGYQVSSAQSDVGGSYTISGLDIGLSYKLLFTDADGAYAMEWYSNADTFAAASPVAASATGINAQLEPGVTITGTLRADGTGIPVPDHGLYAHDPTYDIYLVNATTDTSGVYTLKGLRSGAGVKISFDMGAYQDPRWYDGKGSWATADIVTAPATGIDATVPYNPGATITGTVTNGSSAHLQNISVHAYDAQGSDIEGTHTDSSGNFILDELEDSVVYNILFVDDNGTYAMEWYSNAATLAQSNGVAAPNTGINAQLETGVTITGNLTWATSGDPVTDYFVSWADPGRECLYSGVTACQEDGTYTLKGLRSATAYKVYFTFGGYGQDRWYHGKNDWAGATIVTAPASGINDTLPDSWPGPSISSITPNCGTKGQIVSVTNLAGANFDPAGPTTVKLLKGAASIDATDVQVVNPNRITCKFDLRAAQAGAWDVYVENPDLQSATKPAAFTVRVAPSVSSVSPVYGPPGTTVTVKGSGFGTSQAAGGAGANGSGASYVSFNGLKAIEYSKWTNSEIRTVVPDGAAAGPVTVTTAVGPSGTAQVFNVCSPTWYLAEGTSDWGFDTYVTMENPNSQPVTVKVTYMTKSGPRGMDPITLPALSQSTINPRDTLGSTDFSTKVECVTPGKTIAVDRRMLWTGRGAASQEGHSSVGVTCPSKKWYLAEGSSKWGFECWLLIQNPGQTEAHCRVTYMIEGGNTVTKDKVVPPLSRASFSMFDDIGAADASIKVESDTAVIPERAMYRNDRREGHDSIGTTAPAQDYFLAEGTSDWGFTSYVLVQNPNPAAANVTVTYMATDGPHAQPTFQMPANSRRTIRVNDVLPSKDFSTQVHADRPIVAERAMYWGAGGPLGEACHDSIGMPMGHRVFYLPDGETQNGYETWTLVQNPNDSKVVVRVQYLRPGGKDNVSFDVTMLPKSRQSFSMADRVPSGKASVEVTCLTAGKKIMVERAMYWNNRGAGTDTIGGYGD